MTCKFSCVSQRETDNRCPAQAGTVGSDHDDFGGPPRRRNGQRRGKDVNSDFSVGAARRPLGRIVRLRQNPGDEKAMLLTKHLLCRVDEAVGYGHMRLMTGHRQNLARFDIRLPPPLA